jgi:uncharacterized protein YicC (UPF0701 family)
MSAPNTKASKIDRLLSRQVTREHLREILVEILRAELQELINSICEEGRLKHAWLVNHIRAIEDKLEHLPDAAQQAATIKVLSGTVQSLEAENKRLRKYLGSVLLQRRQGEQLEPRWGGRGAAKPREPRPANAYADNPLPHTDAL